MNASPRDWIAEALDAPGKVCSKAAFE